jgi:hypothetical protein
MKKLLAVSVLALLLVSAAGAAETGIGVSALYPGWAIQNLDDGFRVNQIFIGATVRSKHSLLLLDLGGLYGFSESVVSGFADAGVCFDLFFFRFGLVGGINGLYLMDDGEFSFCLNGKANVDVKLGPVTAGLSLMLPIYPVGAEFADEYQYDILFAYHGGLYANLIYWF